MIVLKYRWFEGEVDSLNHGYFQGRVKALGLMFSGETGLALTMDFERVVDKHLNNRTHRTLLTGMAVPNYTDLTTLSPIITHCPAKYLIVDAETGEVYHWATDKWVQAGEQYSKPIIAALRAYSDH